MPFLSCLAWQLLNLLAAPVWDTRRLCTLPLLIFLLVVVVVVVVLLLALLLLVVTLNWLLLLTIGFAGRGSINGRVGGGTRGGRTFGGGHGMRISYAYATIR